MGLLSTLLGPFIATERSPVVYGLAFLAFIAVLVVGNVLKQLLFKNPKEPPVVFHLLPFFGNTIEYGIDPVKFFFKCREKVSEKGGLKLDIEAHG
jgi:hypothetical protein